MKKISTIPVAFIMLVLLAAGCGPAEDQNTAVPTLPENVVTESENESGIAPVSNVSAPVAQQGEPGAAAAGDVVTEQTYVNIYRQVNPAVVNIQVVGADNSFTFEQIIPEIPDIPEHEREELEEYFRQLPDGTNPDDLPSIPSFGQGSGFVYDQEGHIITNNHVVQGAERITVIFSDGTEAEATLVGADPGSDLAVIKVEVDAALLRPVTIADSDALEVGQLVATIGNPYGLDGSMSTGIVSGLGRTLPGAVAPGGAWFNIPNIIQTDAVINPGNSGGPLLNLDGQVIGVNTAIQNNPTNIGLTPSFGGVGYAVPSNIVARVVPELIANGQIAHPWIGISGNTLNSALAEAMGIEIGQRGVLVGEVLEGGPAAKAGLRGSDELTVLDGFDVPIGGDIIVQIDEQAVNEFEDLLGYIVTRASVGQEVTVKVLRDGELVDLTVTLEARPSN